MSNIEPEGLSAEARAARAASFGGVADLYERFRPGPPVEAVEWLLSGQTGTVIDLGAGTGALSRLLVDRVDEVIAVEPDARMRAVFADAVPGVRAVEGRGESMPLLDGSVDAVLASTSWHWVEPVAGLTEVRRVLRPGGVMGALWSGPDVESPFVVQATQLLSGGAATEGGTAAEPLVAAEVPDELATLANPTTDGGDNALVVPDGVPFAPPEHRVFRWDVALNADELIGLLETFSWVITMEAGARERVLTEARRLLRDGLGIVGEVTVDVGFRCQAFRTHPHG